MASVDINDLYLLGVGIGCMISAFLGFNGGQQR